MYTVSHDYYAILGVSKNATPEEIGEQYRKLMKEHHPDQFKGMRAKYQSEGDQSLLKVIDERIREAEEKCKLLNEAFEVLSDPVKRKEYDKQVVEPTVPLPEISIHPTRITFGSLTEGQEKSLVFIIENKGGPPAAVNIDWEGNKLVWGELVIEPDEEKVFPIKVTVKADTTGIPSGPKHEKVVVNVDGRIHLVEIFLSVTRKVVASATPTSPPTRTYSPAPMSPAPLPAPPTKMTLIQKAVVTFVVISCIWMILWWVTEQSNERSFGRVEPVRTTPTAVAATKTAVYEQQQRATQEARFKLGASSLVLIDAHRRRCQDCIYDLILYSVTNKSSAAVWILLPGTSVPYKEEVAPGETKDHVIESLATNLEEVYLTNGRLCLNFWAEAVGDFTACADVPDELAPQ